MTVTLKNLKTMRGTDGPMFTATIYLDGQRAGYVTQAGHGGPNSYDFHDGFRPQFAAEAAAWAAEAGETFEPWDAFINHLIREQDFAKAKAKNTKRGYPVSVLVQSDPYMDNGSVLFYQDESIYGLRSAEDVVTLQAEHPDANVRVL